MERRNTIQRDMVLEAVSTLANHASAEDIYKYVSEKYPSVGKGTVYRNLNILAEEGAIRKVEVPGGSDRFDHTLTNHYHARCIKCSKVFDIDMDYMEDMTDRIKDSHGFEILTHDVIFRGICPGCQKNCETITQNNSETAML